MRKRTLSIMITVGMLFVLPLTAFAENESSMSTIVTYTKEAETDPSPAPTVPSSTYEINIPALISLNECREIHFFSKLYKLK